jgi:HK97 family phage major capsid protein
MIKAISKIPTFFAGPGNCWMGSRATKAAIRNTRAGADNLPVFSPTEDTLLGYRFVLNDYLPQGVLLFGDFNTAVHIRRSRIALQRMGEHYREAGKIAFRFYLRSDAGFFSEAASSSDIEQPLVMLTGADFGS